MHPVDESTLETVSGSLAAIGCATVILTYYIFKDIRNLRYVELVFYVTLNDMIASVGVALGRSNTGSFVCWFQALTSNINYLSAILWTTVITYQLWLAVYHNVTIKDMRAFHIFCWGFPVLLSLLVFTTNTYGNNDDQSAWCFVSNQSDSPRWGVLFWDVASFYFWIWIALLTNMYLIASALRKLKSMPQDTEVARKAVELTRAKVKRLIMYPVVLMISWIPSSVADIYSTFHSDTSVNISHLYRAATFLSILEGLLLSIVFFYMNPMIRNKWRVLLTKQYLYLRRMIGCKDSISGNNRNNRRGRFNSGDLTESVDGADPNNSSRVRAMTVTDERLEELSAEESAYNVEDEPDFIAPDDRLSVAGTFSDLLLTRSTSVNGEPARLSVMGLELNSLYRNPFARDRSGSNVTTPNPLYHSNSVNTGIKTPINKRQTTMTTADVQKSVVVNSNGNSDRNSDSGTGNIDSNSNNNSTPMSSDRNSDEGTVDTAADSVITSIEEGRGGQRTASGDHIVV